MPENAVVALEVWLVSKQVAQAAAEVGMDFRCRCGFVAKYKIVMDMDFPNKFSDQWLYFGFDNAKSVRLGLWVGRWNIEKWFVRRHLRFARANQCC